MHLCCAFSCLQQPNVATLHKLLQHSAILQQAAQLRLPPSCQGLPAVGVEAVQRARLFKQPELLAGRQRRASDVAAGGEPLASVNVCLAHALALADAKQKDHLGQLAEEEAGRGGERQGMRASTIARVVGLFVAAAAADGGGGGPGRDGRKPGVAKDSCSDSLCPVGSILAPRSCSSIRSSAEPTLISLDCSSMAAAKWNDTSETQAEAKRT